MEGTFFPFGWLVFIFIAAIFPNNWSALQSSQLIETFIGKLGVGTGDEYDAPNAIKTCNYKLLLAHSPPPPPPLGEVSQCLFYVSYAGTKQPLLLGIWLLLLQETIVGFLESNLTLHSLPLLLRGWEGMGHFLIPCTGCWRASTIF